MTRALPVLAAIVVLAVPGFAAEAPPAAATVPPDASLVAAREALLVAQQHLRIAGTAKPDEYGGHRKLALELVNTALEQVDSGLRVAAEAAAKREQAAKEKQAQSRRKRRR